MFIFTAAEQDEMKTLLRNFELFTAASIKAEVRNVELLLLWKNLGRKVSSVTHFCSLPSKAMKGALFWW